MHEPLRAPSARWAGTGGRPICVDFSGQSTVDRIALHCNDFDPCTGDVCSPPPPAGSNGVATGACNNNPIMGTTAPIEVSIFGITRLLDGGCEGDHPDGCATQSCRPIGGRNGCNPSAPFVPRFGNSEVCSPIFPSPPPGDCAVHACDGAGSCDILNNDALCEDGLDCTVDECVGFVCDYSALESSTCLINLECFASGDRRNFEGCGECNPDLDPRGWSPCE